MVPLRDKAATLSNPLAARSSHIPEPVETCSVFGFPRLYSTTAENIPVHSYTRSLLLQGHGFPLWCPQGVIPKNAKYLRKGVAIGDVGVVDDIGTFSFFFNIFCPPEDPVHKSHTPPGFRHIDPPAASEIHFVPDCFKPGTVICSDGVKVTKQGQDPLEFKFKSRANEGGVLLLPDGASREDLLQTDHRIYEYIQQNACSWYEFARKFAAHGPAPNGSLMIVTGCDKTKEWATAAFTNVRRKAHRTTRMHYIRRPDARPVWNIPSYAQVNSYRSLQDYYRAVPQWFRTWFGDEIIEDGTWNQCIFIRGIRVSLSTQKWAENVPSNRRTLRSYIVSHIYGRKPIFEHIVDMVATPLRLVRQEREMVASGLRHKWKMQLFHPNNILGQIYLNQFPRADICLVHDWAWCQYISKKKCTTLPRVWDLVDKVLDNHDVVIENDCLTLVPKTISVDKSRWPTSIQSFRDLFTLQDRPRVMVYYFSREWRFSREPKGSRKQ